MSSAFRKLAYATSACALYSFLSTPVMAQTQGQLEEIIVTAQKQEENLQKIPLSVTAFNEKSLEQRGITNILDLGISMPGLQVAQFGGAYLPFLRGVGNTANAVGNESSVATYIDGVYFTRLNAGFFDLGNVQRVEVLKGPQGTLFGRNSTGGVIHIITRDPSYTTGVNGTISYGRFDTIEGKLYATTGLSDKVAVDLSVAGRSQRSGWGRNIITGKRHGYSDHLVSRLKLLFEPSDNTRIVLGAFQGYGKVPMHANVYPGQVNGYQTAPFLQKFPIGFYDSDNDYKTFSRSRTYGTTLRIEHEFDFARFTSISAFMRERETFFTDADFGPRPDQTVELRSTVKQFTQELQLGSLPSSAFSWIVGLYYYDTTSRYNKADIIQPAGFGDLHAPARQKSRSYAAFAQASYEILPKLKLTGGLRYTMDKTNATGALLAGTFVIFDGPPSSKDINRVTFKAALDYQLADDVLTYFSFSRGYKTGNFNILTYDPVPQKPETIDAYEIGFKSDLLDKRLRLNAAAFYYDIGNPQVQLARNNTIILSNAQSARIKGFEIDATAIPVEGLTMRGSMTYLDPKYKRYANAPSILPNPNPPFGVLPPVSVDASGNRIAYASKLTFNAGFDYVLPVSNGEWTLTADYYYNDGFFWEPNNFLHQGSYGLLSGQIRYAPTERFAVRVWGKNLTGKKYVSHVGSENIGYPYDAAPPRTYGISLDFNF